MQSQVVRTLPFFDGVVHTGNSLREVNDALRNQLKSQVRGIVKTGIFGQAAGGVLKVRIYLLGNIGCIGEGEYCPTRDGTIITVRVRWPNWLWVCSRTPVHRRRTVRDVRRFVYVMDISAVDRLPDFYRRSDVGVSVLLRQSTAAIYNRLDFQWSDDAEADRLT
jgi:hypothetical protein